MPVRYAYPAGCAWRAPLLGPRLRRIASGMCSALASLAECCRVRCHTLYVEDDDSGQGAKMRMHLRVGNWRGSRASFAPLRPACPSLQARVAAEVAERRDSPRSPRSRPLGGADADLHAASRCSWRV